MMAETSKLPVKGQKKEAAAPTIPRGRCRQDRRELQEGRPDRDPTEIGRGAEEGKEDRRHRQVDGFPPENALSAGTRR